MEREWDNDNTHTHWQARDAVASRGLGMFFDTYFILYLLVSGQAKAHYLGLAYGFMKPKSG